jgi:hypothetical protein
MEKPNYYAIIPAEVRYDKKLTAGAKLLYGEITALSNKNKYCWASNKYFSECYEVSERTIQLWLGQLEKGNYILRKEIGEGIETERRIYLSIDPKFVVTEKIMTKVPYEIKRARR